MELQEYKFQQGETDEITGLLYCSLWLQDMIYNKKLEKKLTASKLCCFRRLLGINWRQKITNEKVIERLKELSGDYEPLIEVVRWQKLKWFQHVSRKPRTLAQTVMHGIV